MFQHIVCWQPERLYAVVSTQAESARPEVFTAVHTSYPLNVGTGQSRQTLDEQEFLTAFLASHRNHVQVVVLGEPGSGKSHLVQWLALNIPGAEHRIVLSIPRARTTLRGIIERLIQLLDAGDRAPYEKLLKESPQAAASREELHDRLISSLVVVLRRRAESGDLDETASYLAEGLRALLTDPAMRQFHVGQSGIIAELVRHIAEPGGDARDARRQFAEQDLHHQEALTRIDDFADPTRRFLRQLQRSDNRQLAIKLLNDCQDDAVTDVLGFTGEALVSLMADIRQHLGSQGKELVILFEDFARAEGIDRALLDSLMEQSDGAPGSPAKLRWAIAVTRGYFENSLLETHRARMDFVIDMALTRGTEVDDAGLLEFAARYLNALRLNEEELKRWHDTLTAGDRRPLRNACTECRFREECHPAFGVAQVPELGEVGLYPFTADALLNLYERRGDQQEFNPRALLDHIVKPVCDAPRARHIVEGEFPDANLLPLMGGGKLSANLAADVRNRYGQDADRYMALLELWSGRPGAHGRLADGVYTAFGLRPLDVPDVGRPIQADTPPMDPPQRPPPSVPELTLRRRLEAVTAWFNGSPFSQELAAHLRPLVYSAIETYIDWDELHISTTAFAGATAADRPFRQLSIYFRGQETGQPSTRPVNLVLPLHETTEARTRMALSLQGLLNFAHRGSWRYEGGEDELQALAESLEEWAADVVRQLWLFPVARSEWDAVGTATEALAMGAAMGGRPAGEATAVERINAMFGDWRNPDEYAGFVREWRVLYEALYNAKGALCDFVRQRATLGKGGQARALVDAVHIVPVVDRLRRDWQLREGPPEGVNPSISEGGYRQAAILHRRLQAEVKTAVEAELARRREMLAYIRTYLPTGTTGKDVVSALESLRQVAAREGVPIPPGLQTRVQESLQAFSALEVDRAIRAAEGLEKRSDSLQCIPDLGSVRTARALEGATAFFETAEDYFSRIESHIKSRTLGDVTGQEVDGLIHAVDSAFGEIDTALARIEGGQ